jgi:hypothetical protein
MIECEKGEHILIRTEDSSFCLACGTICTIEEYERMPKGVDIFRRVKVKK